MKRTVQLIDADYTIEDGEVTVRCFCKSENGQDILALDKDFLPYLYVIPKEAADIEELKEEISERDFREEGEPLPVEKIEKKRLSDLNEEREVLKVYTNIPPRIPKLKNKLWDMETIKECREFDIPFYRRYLIDQEIRPCSWIEIDGEEEKESELDSTLILNELETETGVEKDPGWSMAAFDLEVYKDRIIMASFYGEEYRAVLTTEDIDKQYVEQVDSEKELIQRIVEIVEELELDILVGYNTDEFDFNVLRERSEKHGVELSMGRNGERMKFNRRGRFKGARLKGRMHLDLYPFVEHVISPGLESETLDLDSVSEEILGMNKEDLSWEEMKESWRKKNNLEEFAEYALKDSELVHKLGKELVPQITELSRIIGLIPFDGCRLAYGQLTENYLLREAKQRDKIAPNRPSQDKRKKRRREGAYAGGFVYEPEPGLHENIALCDFKSLYPTVMVAHNVSPDTLNIEDCDSSFELEEFDYDFCQDSQGFFPELVEGLVKGRSEIKEEMGEMDKDDPDYKSLDSRQRAQKVLANSFYGYLGYNSARWYSRECAEAITYLGRRHIQETIDRAEQEGYEVVYGDSLNYSRQIVLKDPSGKIVFRKIGEFVEDEENAEKYETLSFDIENEKLEFKRVKRAIKHSYNDKLLRFDTNRGRTEVTPQHSVYKFDNGGIELADAAELEKGDKLVSLTNIPDSDNIHEEGDILDLINIGLDNDPKAYIDKKRFPAERGQCPYCGEEYYLSSHVHSQHPDRKVDLEEAEDKHKFIGSQNAKGGRIPRFWELSTEFAWVLGFYAGDGSCSLGEKKMLSFGGQNKDLIMRVKEFFDEILGEDLQIIEDIDDRTGNKMYYYRVQRKPAVDFFVNGLNVGKGSKGKEVPEVILNGEKSLKNSFLNGYIAADGSVESEVDERYKSENVRFSSKSSFLSNQIHYLLKELKNGENKYGNSLGDVSYKYRSDKPEIKSIRNTASRNPVYNKWNFTPAKINNIESIEPEKNTVYDIEVEGHHNFVDAEGLILVHNTDSVFLQKENIRNEIDGFLENINTDLPSFMRLELEGHFVRGFFTSTDSGGGAKKKYALMDEKGGMKITGFEQVRRDWSPIAKKTQKEVLRKVLQDEVDEAAELVKETIERLKGGEVPVEDLRIYTTLTKKPENYDSTAPHVEAAKKAIKRGEDISPGDTISYVVTRGGGSISQRAELTKFADDYDSEYYIENQVLPVTLRVLKVFDYTEGQLKGEGKQSGLGRFG